ncbi:Streptothricin hydrolase [compost metagenome]
MTELSNRSALLVVDVQVAPFIWKDFGGKELYRSEALIETLETLIKQARTAGSPVIYLQYTERGESLRAEGGPLWPIHPVITPREGDLVLVKYETDSFHGTNLHEELQARGIGHVVVTGVQTEFCVDTTCRSAQRLGYRTTLVADGHSTFDTNRLTAEMIVGHHNDTLGAGFTEVTAAKEVEFR